MHVVNTRVVNMRAFAHLTCAKLKKLACACIVACNFGICKLASEYTLHLRDAHHEYALHEPHTLHVWCSYSRCRQWITDWVVYTVLLKIPNKWMCLYWVCYLCYDMSEQVPMRSWLYSPKIVCMQMLENWLWYVCSIYSYKLPVYNKILSVQKTF